jgi:hypothetical protein
MNAPKNFAELRAQWPQIQRDIARVRALANLKLITTAGVRPVQFSEQDAVADIRFLAPAGGSSAPTLPVGEAGQVLVSEGATGYSWL